MNINKDNYEEYFLLYADNELSEVEKDAVETFVKQHPDLEEELLIIKLSVSKPDEECVLDDKSFLLKETGKFINHSNYQEVFVLYHDNELNGYEREEAESFLLKNPQFKNEFKQFKKSKLQADNTIGFPGKKLLYKREDKGKVIVLKWWKAAAAAILVGIGLWSGIAYLQNNNTGSTGMDENNTAKKPPVNVTPAPTNRKDVQPVNVVAENKERKTEKQKLVAKRNFNKPSVKKDGLPNENKNDLPVVKNQTPSNNLPERDINTVDIDKEKMKVEARNEIDPISKNIDTDNSVSKISTEDHLATSNEDSGSRALTTSFIPDENENNNNYAFYNIPQEKFNKSKIGGFLRKVKRIIERKISPLNNSKDKTEIAVN